MEDNGEEKNADEIENIISSTSCAYCDGILQEPWIRCVGCPKRVNICTNCFAMGFEFGSHENNHPYTVIKFDCQVYDKNWTASEELQLLDAIIENGFGNWPAISRRMRTKSAMECERHYLHCYVENPQSPLPEFKDDRMIDYGAPIVFKLSDNPPRPPEGSMLSHEMGGYSAARGDFTVEFDNYFEMDICQMKMEDWSIHEENEEEHQNNDFELYTEMNIKVLDIYRNCLKERQWRKKIVQDYGLINMRKWYGTLRRRFERNVSFEFFRPFMRLYPAIVFDKYLESLLYEKQLKADIVKLQEYRRNGIKSLHAIPPYHVMKQRREHTRAKRHLLQDVLSHIKDENSVYSWLARQADLEAGLKLPTVPVPLARKQAPPLNIEGMPGYDVLNEAERELCSESRLVPKAYLDFSKILKTECAKHGFLRLAQARNLIKIDVNKTRKIYNFMLLYGHINKDPT